ncbi:MAG: thiamine-phosphate kinase, partial [Proteobacteria bacterium]|nr:thiamine-phosphate kinase [Pseudomonadota bacterium]
TADKRKNRIIQLIAKKLKIKITKIGIIMKQTDHPNIIVKKGRKIRINQKGYFHQF